ncbi:MAG: arginine--tRNA ligase [Patescibacteria group bacterium]
MLPPLLVREALVLLRGTLSPDIDLQPELFSAPPDPTLGDLAFGCFPVAKASGKNPVLVAKDLVDDLTPRLADGKGLIARVAASGPYLNFFVDPEKLVAAALSAKTKPLPPLLPKGERRKMLIEYANPNTHKDVHVGHLRNFVLGAAVIRLERTLGHEVIGVSYINDLGNNVAKCLWAVARTPGWEKTPAPERVRFLDKAYVEATAAAEADAAVRAEISHIQKTLERFHAAGLADIAKKDRIWVKVWKTTHAWSKTAINAVIKELGWEIEKQWFESELIAETVKIVAELEAKGIARVSEGALIVDLADEKLGVNLLRKTDGTLLYNAKDIALALRKEATFHPDESVYVIDARQSLAMKQLFATLRRMGHDLTLRHLAYEFVTLPEGAMSSRKGNVIYYADFRDDVVTRAKEEVVARHDDWSAAKASSAARAVAMGGIVFALLKQDTDKQIVFDVDEAVSFDGYTGPYIQYTAARISSLARKAGTQKTSRSKGTAPVADAELRLAFALLQFPAAVRAAADSWRPSVLCQELFELSKTFAVFYEQAPILSAEPVVRARRLALAKKVGDTLAEGCGLLGIPLVEEM